MADPKNLYPRNPNNSTNDDRVIWEDGTWAVIEAGDCWDGLARSKTRDNPGDAIAAPWDPGMTTMPGPQSVAGRKLVKVKLADVLAKPTTTPASAAMPQVKDWSKAPVAPVSPFLPKPWAGRNVPEFPHVCIRCGGRYYWGLNKSIHEATETGPLQGACPGAPAKTRGMRV